MIVPELTYEISVQDGFRIYCENEEFRKILKEGNFIHCENRFVINHPKYVTFNKKEIASLTEYAKTHESECCLVFTLVPNEE